MAKLSLELCDKKICEIFALDSADVSVSYFW